MSTQLAVQQTALTTAEILEMIELLEPGERRFIYDVSWDDYEELLAALGEGYGVRIAYTEGTLEIMAPLYRHERDKETLTAMIRLLAKARGIKSEAAGSTTLKRKTYRRGAEPDTSFYLGNASHMIGKETIDLRVDPPPDLVVEVDVTNPSSNKKRTYARFGVPEFWRAHGTSFEIFALVNRKYVARTASLAFPFVQAKDLASFLEQSRIEGQDAALTSFEAWLTNHSPAR